jgi:hypothetical protein
MRGHLEPRLCRDCHDNHGFVHQSDYDRKYAFNLHDFGRPVLGDWNG